MMYDSDEEKVLLAFCDAHRAKKPFDLDTLYEALKGMGYGLRQNDPNHDQGAPCARCTHPYHRHFDPYEDDREVGCKYCHDCYEFVEPEQWKLEHP